MHVSVYTKFCILHAHILFYILFFIVSNTYSHISIYCVLRTFSGYIKHFATLILY